MTETLAGLEFWSLDIGFCLLFDACHLEFTNNS